MARLNKSERQEIIRGFASHHGGLYNPATFVDEVRAVGKSHPAYGWFTWDRTKAAFEHQVWQAREFVVGLRVRFTIEEVGRSGKIRIVTREVPFAISPLEVRHAGGGYFVVDPDNPEHMEEHCRQAAVALTTWLSRYEAAITYAGGSLVGTQKTLRLLESATGGLSDKAA